jgi:hypothetical protein
MNEPTYPAASTIVGAEDTRHVVDCGPCENDRRATSASRLTNSDGVGRRNSGEAGDSFPKVAGMPDAFVGTDPELARFTQRVHSDGPRCGRRAER